VAPALGRHVLSFPVLYAVPAIIASVALCITRIDWPSIQILPHLPPAATQPGSSSINSSFACIYIVDGVLDGVVRIAHTAARRQHATAALWLKWCTNLCVAAAAERITAAAAVAAAAMAALVRFLPSIRGGGGGVVAYVPHPHIKAPPPPTHERTNTRTTYGNDQTHPARRHAQQLRLF
jgi:hypothetical protein